MSVTQLGYLGLAVRDLARWQHLATDILGLQIAERSSDGSLYLRMYEYHHRIVLHPADEDCLLYAGWQVANAQAFATLRERLASAGVVLHEGSADERAHRKVVGLVQFEDPNGYPFELFHGPLIPGGPPFRPSRPMSGFRAGALGLGHILGSARDMRETEAFYVDLLGFRVSDYSIRGSVFFHCNPRHHSIALSPAPVVPRLHHLMLEAQSLDDVGRALDLCEDAGIPIVTTLGKHSNDHVISFYLETPSGFSLEYGWNGRLIDDAAWEAPINEAGDLWGHRRPRAADEAARRPDPARTQFPWLLRPEPLEATR